MAANQATGDQATGPRRAYRSPRREQQAAETRAMVAAAAARLFGERGWAATGMREVARAAGVSVETVYASFRSKGDLLLAAIDVAVVGDAAPVPLDQRPEFAALGSGTRRERARATASLVAGINRRTAGVVLALREAAASDAELAERRREREQRRRINVEQGAALVAGRAVTAEEVDGLWALVAVEVYQMLTELRGWTPQQYESWLADVIERLLPGPDQHDLRLDGIGKGTDMNTAKRRVARTCRAEVIADAPVESVWQVVADVTRTGEWSHECLNVSWLGRATAAAPGARFRGRNRAGWLRWSRTCEVLAVDPPRQIAWRTIPTPLFVDSSDWRITLEPAGAGTRIVQIFEVTKCPRWWEWIVARVVPRHIDRSAALTDDLRRIAAVAAADVRRTGGDPRDIDTNDPSPAGL